LSLVKDLVVISMTDTFRVNDTVPSDQDMAPLRGLIFFEGESQAIDRLRDMEQFFTDLYDSLYKIPEVVGAADGPSAIDVCCGLYGQC